MATSSADRLTLYDQYGSLAYGIILQIVPQPHLAQEVLVEVFAAPELLSNLSQLSSTALSIARLARAKALAVKTRLAMPTFSERSMTTTDPAELSKLVYELSFCQGCTVDQIADRLQLSKADVLMAIQAYFKKIRQS